MKKPILEELRKGNSTKDVKYTIISQRNTTIKPILSERFPQRMFVMLPKNVQNISKKVKK